MRAAAAMCASSTSGCSSERPVRATAAGPSVPAGSMTMPWSPSASAASAGSACATATRSRPRSVRRSTMHQSASAGTSSQATLRSVAS